MAKFISFSPTQYGCQHPATCIRKTVLVQAEKKNGSILFLQADYQQVFCIRKGINFVHLAPALRTDKKMLYSVIEVGLCQINMSQPHLRLTEQWPNLTLTWQTLKYFVWTKPKPDIVSVSITSPLSGSDSDSDSPKWCRRQAGLLGKLV